MSALELRMAPGYYFPWRQVGNQIYLELNNGCLMPMVGLGTWQSKPEETRKAVRQCVKAGYRLIDTAYAYQNEDAIGDELQALFKEGVIKREDIFVTTKLPFTHLGRDDVMPMLKSQLESLKLAYVDLYLIHNPAGAAKPTPEESLLPIDKQTGKLRCDYTVHYTETWKAMEDCYRAGLTKAIGVSNFNIRQTEDILLRANIRPAVNQFETHPYLVNKDLIQYCQRHNIAVTGYSILGNPGNTFTNSEDPSYPKPMRDETLKAIATKYKGKSVAQIMLRYQIQRGVAVIPKSVHEDRIKENLNVFDFGISDQDMVAIEKLDKCARVSPWAIKGFSSHRDYPFDDCRDTF